MSEAYLNSINKTIIVCKVKRKKSQNGYRQLGPIGNFVNAHSYSDCGTYELKRSNKQQNIIIKCMLANAKMDQQNIIALTKR